MLVQIRLIPFLNAPEHNILQSMFRLYKNTKVDGK